MTTAVSEQETQATEIEIYWMPGCSACLRLKEFMEKTGKPYTAINCDAAKDATEKLTRLGRQVPAASIGDRCVPGVDLVAVAELIGVEYQPPTILPKEVLKDRYMRILDTIVRFAGQLTPEVAAFKLPNRDRTVTQLFGHASRTMRYFLGKYEDDEYDGEDYLYDAGDLSPQELAAYAEETRRQFMAWWEQDGKGDPMEETIPLYWGHRTVLEGFEREVWHTAQHTRQMAYWLEHNGITPDRPLDEQTLNGLPLPERIHD
ncbi:DinB family protein [Mycolicibacterium farcinogenes]|uniref:glutaredoxin domain-containing protein n=1 Tax=Mycolicibacterium farcinogenes TaxID=1802 RepID=UPI001C8E4A17|nr:DinB family protein [Mycolicibacterium farcinogenes]QZH60916.1 DinB family protein [Mycolicibacterium farcinogenes]